MSRWATGMQLSVSNVTLLSTPSCLHCIQLDRDLLVSCMRLVLSACALNGMYSMMSADIGLGCVHIRGHVRDHLASVAFALFSMSPAFCNHHIARYRHAVFLATLATLCGTP